MFGPVAAITIFLARAFHFSGRATRAEFWWAQLGFLCLMALVIARDGRRIIEQAPLWAENPGLASPVGLLSPWLALAAFIPMLSLTIRRLHDAGYSGFWYLLQLVPVIGPIVLFVICISASEQDENRWGPPRDPEDPMGYGATGRDRVPAPAARVAVGQTATRTTSRRKKPSPWDGYALILEENQGDCPHREAARKAEISAYYRSRVLGEAPVQAAE